MDIVKVAKIVPECERVSTIRFTWDREVLPGQFVMVWLPGGEEVPMSVSFCDSEKGITVEKRGKTTAAIHELGIGSKLGIRGPYGNGFRISGDDVLIVGGGTGTAPLAPLAEKLVAAGKKVTTAIGARTACELVFVRRFEEAGCAVFQATDDGTEGHGGFVTELALRLLAEHEFDVIYTCGPEPMMVELVRQADRHGVPIQCSLERYMKCGIGLCDSCSLDGLRVCKDGPVFDGGRLLESEEFGASARSKSGRKVLL